MPKLTQEQFDVIKDVVTEVVGDGEIFNDSEKEAFRTATYKMAEELRKLDLSDPYKGEVHYHGLQTNTRVLEE